MGADKQATDLCLFGRPRPDLTGEELFAEWQKRQNAVDGLRKRRTTELAERAPELIAGAKRHGSAQ